MRIMPYRHRPTNAATSMDILAVVVLIPPTPNADACTKRTYQNEVFETFLPYIYILRVYGKPLILFINAYGSCLKEGGSERVRETETKRERERQSFYLHNTSFKSLFDLTNHYHYENPNQ